jgi:hypothetical protein
MWWWCNYTDEIDKATSGSDVEKYMRSDAGIGKGDPATWILRDEDDTWGAGWSYRAHRASAAITGTER